MDRMDATKWVRQFPFAGRPLPPSEPQNSYAQNASLKHLFLGSENVITSTILDRFLKGSFFLQDSPWVIHGLTGIGKTHLTRGLTMAWHELHADLEAVYETSAGFMESRAAELSSTASAKKEQSIPDFWILEDLDELVGKEGFQSLVVRQFDEIKNAAGICIFTSRRPPLDLDLIPRLKSRLVSGLVTALTAPAFETRFAIVRELAQLKGIALSHSAANTLAEGIHGSVRNLSGALLLLEKSTQLKNRGILNQDADQFLTENKDEEPLLKNIAKFTAKQFSLRMTDLKSKSRKQSMVNARSVAMYLARTYTGKSLIEIAKFFNRTDHTTVIHAVKKIEQQINSDDLIAHQVELICEQLNLHKAA